MSNRHTLDCVYSTNSMKPRNRLSIPINFYRDIRKPKLLEIHQMLRTAPRLGCMFINKLHPQRISISVLTDILEFYSEIRVCLHWPGRYIHINYVHSESSFRFPYVCFKLAGRIQTKRPTLLVEREECFRSKSGSMMYSIFLLAPLIPVHY